MAAVEMSVLRAGLRRFKVLNSRDKVTSTEEVYGIELTRLGHPP
jgi:hypothetical protein